MPVRYPTTANDRCLRCPLRTDIPRTEPKYHHRREYVRTLIVNVRHCDRAAIGGNFQITHDILLFWDKRGMPCRYLRPLRSVTCMARRLVRTACLALSQWI